MTSELTNREQDILLLIGLGKTNAEIARELELSINTVKTHAKKTLPQARGTQPYRGFFVGSGGMSNIRGARFVTLPA